MFKLPILAILLIATFACGLYVGHKLGFAHAQQIQTK